MQPIAMFSICAVFVLLNGLCLLLFYRLIKRLVLQQTVQARIEEQLLAHSPISESPSVGDFARTINTPESQHHKNIQFNFTNQEEKILRYLLEDYTYKEIADKCCITTSTVNTHVKNIHSKAGVSCRRELKKLFSKAA